MRTKYTGLGLKGMNYLEIAWTEEVRVVYHKTVTSPNALLLTRHRFSACRSKNSCERIEDSLNWVLEAQNFGYAKANLRARHVDEQPRTRKKGREGGAFSGRKYLRMLSGEQTSTRKRQGSKEGIWRLSFKYVHGGGWRRRAVENLESLSSPFISLDWLFISHTQI